MRSQSFLGDGQNTISTWTCIWGGHLRTPVGKIQQSIRAHEDRATVSHLSLAHVYENRCGRVRSLVCVCLVASGSSGLVETRPDSTDSSGLVRARPSRPSRPSRPASSGLVRPRPDSSGLVRPRPASSGLVRPRPARPARPAHPALTPGAWLTPGSPARRLVQLIWLTQSPPRVEPTLALRLQLQNMLFTHSRCEIVRCIRS